MCVCVSLCLTVLRNRLRGQRNAMLLLLLLSCKAIELLSGELAGELRANLYAQYKCYALVLSLGCNCKHWLADGTVLCRQDTCTLAQARPSIRMAARDSSGHSELNRTEPNRTEPIEWIHASWQLIDERSWSRRALGTLSTLQLRRLN